MNNLPGLYLSPTCLQYSDSLEHNYWEDWESSAFWKNWQGDLPDSEHSLRSDTHSFELPQEYLL